jgi:AcrR family transcriptional regulator
MTNDDIIKAAFKVWGRDLYRTTSLAEIAQELGVSKPALYRHFNDKNALLDAMYTAFFDDCAAFIKAGCEEAENTASTQEANLILMRTVAEYYLRNKEAFIFSLIRVYNGRNRKNMAREFRERGINFELLALKRGESYPSMMQLIMVTLFFFFFSSITGIIYPARYPRTRWFAASLPK